MSGQGRGRFFTLEGIEGSGKSTQARRLAAELARDGQAVVATREPGGTPVGRRLREVLLDPLSAGIDSRAELLLYCADRAEHMARVVLPALARGAHVVCDRHSDTTRAYQGFGRGLGLALVDRLNVADAPPDRTVLLDLDARRGLARARNRNRDQALAHESRFEDEEVAFHERVRQGYLELARLWPERIRVVAADRGEDEVFADVLAIAAEALGSR